MARSSERSFQYQERSAADVRERANARGGGFDSMFKAKYKIYKVRDGKNLIRIMPPTWDKARHYGYDLWVNYGIGVDKESYLSLSKMQNAKDPLAEARREAERNGDKDLVKELNPRQRILMWVIDRNDEDEGPQLWPAPFSVDKAFAGLCFDDDTKEVMYIDNPKTGCDVRFFKTGQGLKTDYPAEKMRIQKPSPLHSDAGLMAEWLEFIQLNPLPSCLQFYDYEHIAASFDGVTRGEKDEDEDEKPVRRATNGKVTEPDDDDVPSRHRVTEPDAAEEDPEDDDEPAPLRAKRKAVEPEDDDKPAPVRSRRVVVDPDDDDEPAPVRSRRKVVEPEDDDEPPFERPTRTRTKAPVEDEPDEAPVRSPVRDRLRQRSRIKDDE